MPAHPAHQPSRYPQPPEERLLRAHLARTEDERRFLEQRRTQSQAVVEATRREVEATERALQAAREALESAQFLHESVTNSCRALDDRVTQVRSRLHPERRVPDNILGEIFQYAVNASHVGNEAGPCMAAQRTPFSLAMTCRSWRTVALARARLWHYLDLDMTIVSNDLCAAAAGAADRDEPCQDCRWCRFIRTHLERSKPIPICLRLFGTDRLRVARLLHVWRFVASISPRLRSLEIQYGDLTGSGLDLLLRSDMPILETFAIDCRVSVLSSPFFKSAPLLRDCRWRHFVPKISVDYPALSSIDIVCPVAAMYAPPLRFFHGILSCYCPILETLRIEVARLEDDGTAGDYPTVKEFSLAVSISGPRTDAAIDTFELPSVERLHLSLPSEQTTCSMIQRCSSTLVTLAISGRTLTPFCATPIAGALLLESLELIDCGLTEGFFRTLSSPLPDGSPACPALHKLHIKDCHVSSPDDFTGVAFLQLIRMRNGANMRRVSNVAVSWKDDDVPLLPGFSAELQALLL